MKELPLEHAAARPPLAVAALLALVAAALVPGAAAARTRARISPVEQVLQMMTEMRGKAAAAMEEEQKIFARYEEWVDDRSKELGFSIKTAKSSIEQLTAFVQKAENKVSSLGKAIATLDKDISRMEAEKKDGAAVRETEHAEYVKLHKDYSESVDALERAIQTVSAQAYDRPQAMMLLQRMSQVSPGMDRVMAAFAEQGAEAEGAPAVAAYESQSDGILQLLKGLLKKFKGEAQEVEEAEARQAHAFALQEQHLADAIAKSKADMQERAVTKSKTAAASAKAKGELAETKQELAAEEAFLENVKTTFQTKSDAFKVNQQTRKDELEALSKAVEIISSPSVAGSYGEHVSLAQHSGRAPPALLQTASAQQRLAAHRHAAALLQKRATALASRSLQAFAAQMAESPFSKVIQMIEDMLERLKQEAATEADHKSWCDEQLKSNKLKREKKSTGVKELSAEIEMLEAAIDDGGKAVNSLVEEQAELTKAMQEATEQRDKEKAENLKTIADAKAGSEAVKKALVILKEFYAAREASLLQEREGQVPEMEAYKGLQGKNKGVTGMLEVIASDFVRLSTSTQASEEQAASEYDEFMSNAGADKQRKHNMEVKLRLKKDQDEFQASETKKDLAQTQASLDKANEYYDHLKPTCLEVHVDFEARAARRQEEIAALKEAYGILDSKTAA